MSLEEQLGRLNGNLEKVFTVYEKLVDQNERLLASRGERATAVTETPAAPAPAKPASGKAAGGKTSTKSAPAAKEPEAPTAPAEEEEPPVDLGEEEQEEEVTHATIRACYREVSAAAKEAGNNDKVKAIGKSFNSLLKEAGAFDDEQKPALTVLPADKCAKFLADFKKAIA